MPPLLHVNHEARNLALTSNTPAFALRVSHPVFIDFSRDCVYRTTDTMPHFNSSSLFRGTPASELEERFVKRPIVSREVSWSLDTLRYCARLFPGLGIMVADRSSTNRIKCCYTGLTADRLMAASKDGLREEWAKLLLGVGSGGTKATKIIFRTLERKGGFGEFWAF